MLYIKLHSIYRSACFKAFLSAGREVTATCAPSKKGVNKLLLRPSTTQSSTQRLGRLKRSRQEDQVAIS